MVQSLRMAEADFVDYYELLQISPNAEPETIQRVYRILAARYHPDNPNTGDMEMFLRLREAYEVLGDPEKRAAYSERVQLQYSHPLPIFEMKDFVVGIEAEGNRRLGVLCLLYNRRRSTPDDPSLSLLELEAMTSFPREHLEFTIWYLKEKGFLRRDETGGDYMITSEGIDWVESKVPANRIVYKLLKSANIGQGAGEDTPA
jgi:curved DNA-binding protein CbpA